MFALVPTQPHEPKLLENAYGRLVAYLGTCDDTRKTEIAESELNERTAGFGSKAVSPVRAGEVKREHPLAGNHTGRTKMPVNAAIPDVTTLGFQDGGPQAHAMVHGSQMNGSKLALCCTTRPGLSAHEPADLRIGFHGAKPLEIFGLVIAEHEPFSFENDHGRRNFSLGWP